MVALASQQKPRVKRLHILFQSDGGCIAESVFLYHFFKSCPIDITIYNCGSVQSAATIAFLGAKRRVTSKLAKFMLHPPRLIAKSVPVGMLDGIFNLMNIDNTSLETILKSHLKISDADWASLRNNNDLWFSGEDAVKNGLADEIGDFSPPKGQAIISLTLCAPTAPG
jgi:ATP-dependent protease ClpP protease subunit